MEDDNNELDENEVQTIRYSLEEQYLHHEAPLAYCLLQMPSRSRSFDHKVKWSRPTVTMDIKNPNDIHSLTVMMTCTHKNILHAKIVRADKCCNVVWTEPFTGLLLDYLEDMKLPLGDWTDMVPSMQLQSVVSQWFDGIGQLRLYGKYHGDFRLNNTYYHIESGSQVPLVKLTDFRLKDEKPLIICQVEDVWAIADCLDVICNIAESLNKKIGPHRSLDCTLVIDLAKKLREVSAVNLFSVMKDIKKHIFFWGRPEREKFYVGDLPFALRSLDFKKNVEASDICSIPWDIDPYYGLLEDMNNFRARNNKPPYDGTKKGQFCSFCSGLFTHEFQLPAVKLGRFAVDNVLRSKNPKACFEIVSLMPDAENKYMLSKREVKP